MRQVGDTREWREVCGQLPVARYPVPSTPVIIIEANSLARVFGGRTIFSGVSLSLQERDRIGLVGPSGIGKSSLVRILAGLEPPDGGAITFRRDLKVAYLEQEFAGEPARPVLEEIMAARDDLAELDHAIADAERQMGDPAVLADADAFDSVLHEHDRLLAEYDLAGGPMVRNRAEGFLRDLDFPEDSWSKPMRDLSGGQRKLVGLARCLMAEPDVLLLDEPDNHLDLARKRLLERLVQDFKGAVVVISHDRYLLDEVVTQIAEFEPDREHGARLQLWEGNYTSYATQKELKLLKQQQDYVAQQKEIARLEAAVARFKLWASIVIDERHIKQARNKQRQIDRMDKVERPVLERRKMALRFRPHERGGSKAVEFRSVSKAFSENLVLLAAEGTVWNGERVGVVGPNGAGKSVLLKLILGELTPEEGTVWVGPSIKLGYYSQEHETLDLRQTPIEAIRQTKPMFEGEAVSHLGRFLIPYEATSQPIARMSGGEKSRVQLARLMLMGANCLLLDEPTNNLDIPAAEVLEHALEDFPGTVIVVSHDRYFLDRITDRTIEVREAALSFFDGGYSFYAEQTAQPPAAATPAARR